MGATEVQAFLTMLASVRRVSSSTHSQALSAILLRYREVLGVDLPWMDALNRPGYQRRIPTVLGPQEVARLLDAMQGDLPLLARLLHGTGMRLMEALRLRTKDVDFDREVIVCAGPRAARTAWSCCLARSRWTCAGNWQRRAHAGSRTAAAAPRECRFLTRWSDVSTTMIYTHVLKMSAGATSSPLDAISMG